MLFEVDPSVKESPAWKRAFSQGLIRAKQEILVQMNMLVQVGNPLHAVVIAVSAVHIFGELSRIAPPHVEAVLLPGWAYHLTALLFTAIIDIVAVYILRSRSSAFYVGGVLREEADQEKAHYFFYGLTALLNGAFVVSYMPDMPGFWQWAVLVIRTFLLVALAILVPFSLWAIERAKQRAENIRLMLLAEIEALTEMGKPAVEAPAPAPQRKPFTEETTPKEETTTKEEETAPEPIVLEKKFYCEVCGAEIGVAERAVAGRKKWQAHFEGRYACRGCREKTGV